MKTNCLRKYISKFNSSTGQLLHGKKCHYFIVMIGLQVVSLTEKLQAKEEVGAAISAQKFDPLPGDMTYVSSLEFNVKVEDRLSSGSGGSAVVDEDGPQLVDSGDSYFPGDNYTGFVAVVDGVQSEEDDKSDDGRNYFSDVFAAAEHQHHGEEEEPSGWWVWS